MLSIDESICDVDDVISSIKSSTQTQEDKIKSLESLKENISEYISDVVAITKMRPMLSIKARMIFMISTNT